MVPKFGVEVKNHDSPKFSTPPERLRSQIVLIFIFWKAMGISFPTHLIRASESQFNTMGTVLKKNTTDITVFLEASSFVNVNHAYFRGGLLEIGLGEPQNLKMFSVPEERSTF